MVENLIYTINPIKWINETLNFYPDKWQEDLLTDNSNQIIINITRQGGKSTIVAKKALHRAVFYPNNTILVISPSERQSKELLLKIRTYYEMLPDLIKPGTEEYAKLSITFSNGTRILGLPGSEKTVRGYTANLLIVDEGAGVEEELYNSIRPMLAVTGGQFIILSTPKGKKNVFYDIWHNGTNWSQYRVTADEIPRITPEFLEQERLNLGERWFKQEYYCEFVEDEDQLFRSELIEGIFTDDVDPLNLDLTEVEEYH